VVGQESTVLVLKSIVISGKQESAYLFYGPHGVGKTTNGRIFAKAILCEFPNSGNPCGLCDSCILFDSDKHFGYNELDAATVGGKEDMVKLRDDASYLSPTDKRIILIDECHDISRQGQEALLNQLERCPDHLVYIFCTTEVFKMQRTLRDRCMEFPVTKIDTQLINNRLLQICQREGFQFDIEAIEMIALKADGHMRTAINILEEASYVGPITKSTLQLFIKDYDRDIADILLNLGYDLSKSLEAYRKVSSHFSSIELYNNVISLISDACKCLYGFETFPADRLQILQELKKVHGYGLLEFLNYLISRDKYVDKVGLQSDLIVLHYKFGSNSFVPKEQTPKVEQKLPPVSIDPQNLQTQAQDSTASNVPFLSHAELSKLNVKDRCRFLRDQRSYQKLEQTDQQKVPLQWPLPKEDRIGEDSGIEVLSPQEFSQILVGGRGGEF